MSSHHGVSALAGHEAFCKREHSQTDEDRFGRLFPDLAPLFTKPSLLDELGKAGGVMADEDPQPAETDTVAVGQIFFGQFVDHDVTLDLTSSFDRVNTPELIGNVRTPTLDLDCVYGLGPDDQPYLFVQDDGPFKGVKLVTGAEVGDGEFTADDLPRIGKRAMIGDHRNDENRAVSQIQLGMIRAHNKFVDKLHNEPGNTLEGHALYEEARELLTWHYQWCIVHDFLVKICGEPVVERILSEGRKFYCPDKPFIPVEFSVAAYRFGHTMVPMKVQLRNPSARQRLFGDVFGRGFEPIVDERAVADMHELFDTFAGRNVQRATKCDTKMSADLLTLSENVDPEQRSLATRNMIRGQSFLLPSGEATAKLMFPDEDFSAVDSLISDIFDELDGDAPPKGDTPLWFYILAEAEAIGRAEPGGGTSPGEGLGPVGATIVAEVMIGLIELDSRSWLGSNRNWRPEKVEIDAQEVELSSVGHLLAYGNG